MPRGVEVDLVDPVAVAVVGDEARLVALAAVGVLARLGAAGDLADVAQAVDAPAAVLALDRLVQRGVGLEDVVGLEGRGLVEDLVRRCR